MKEDYDNLDLVETSKLVDALEKRSKAIVVILLHESDGREHKEWFLRGGYQITIGMLVTLMANLFKEEFGEKIELGDNEEWENKS